MAKTSPSVVARSFLLVGGVLVLLAGFLFARLPRPSGPRVEAAYGVVGVETGASYAWVVKTLHGVLLIDAGIDPEAKAILHELSRMGVTPEQVVAIFITHGHGDHWAGLSKFPHAKVYVGPGEGAFIKKEKRYGSLIAPLGERVWPRQPPPQQLVEVNGGESIEIDGETIHAHHLPGHTPGSMAYRWRDLLFTGDSLLRDGSKVMAAPFIFSEDAKLNLMSLASLRELPFTRIADGHTGVTEDARQKLLRLLE